MKNIRVALIITNSPFGKIDDNLEKVCKWVRKATENDVQLICFPELNVSGYTTRKGISLPDEDDFEKAVAYIRNLAKNERITILAGMMEKRGDKTIYASHVVFDPRGLLGIYRKIHLAPVEKPLFSAGNEIPLFETDGVKFGIQLCYDAHFPELSTRMAIDGAEVIFIPHASPRGEPDKKYQSWMRHLQARAYDNSVFILAVNQVGDNQMGLTFPGVAMVIAPSGEVISQKLGNEEAMLIADLKEKDFTSVRSNRMHFFLPNRRKDLFDGT